jgi:ribose transport system substrate-binding protein
LPPLKHIEQMLIGVIMKTGGFYGEGDSFLRKTVVVLLCIVGITLFYFTASSAEKVLQPDWQLPKNSEANREKVRLVLITQELETPFWEEVGSGALKQAEEEGANLEIWGSYGNNKEDFLKEVEIAIHSKVDGIIVQGLDTEEFKELTKFKAAFYGIPIITVANDVQADQSLRRTYVGSNQYLAGKMIANQLLKDMGPTGKVALIGDLQQDYYQKQRLQGILDVFKNNPGMSIIRAETTDTKDQVIATTQELLNNSPNVDGFIAVDADMAGAMIQEIERRAMVEPYYIYTFDDGPETMRLLSERKLDAVIKQSPESMGKVSVSLIMKWLRGETVPLNMDGYHTDITVLKAMDF